MLVTALTITIASPSFAQSGSDSSFSLTRAERVTLYQSALTNDEEDPKNNKCSPEELKAACLILEACYAGARDNDNVPGDRARDVVDECAKRVGCTMRKGIDESCELEFKVYKHENEDGSFKDLWCNNPDITGTTPRQPFNDGEVEVPTAEQCAKG